MIRPFRLGDTFLLQRLQRQATRLNVAQALLHPRSPTLAALTAVKPWDTAKVVTYVLHQSGHGLARSGFLQAQRRPGRAEADILLLAPALDTRTGHPAIWEKLLAHYLYEATQHATSRLYADVPDQPLLVNTLAHVGFTPYARQTVWRLAVDDMARPQAAPDPCVRPVRGSDEWELRRLYTRVTPRTVQLAEGAIHGQALRPPILEWWGGGDVQTLVYAPSSLEGDALEGCLRLVQTRRAAWMQIWADARRPDSTAAYALLRAGLLAAQSRRRVPIYTAVREYQGGVGPLLNRLGFAPIADHAKLVKHLLQRVVEVESARHSVVETVPEVVVTAGSLSALSGDLMLPLRHRKGHRVDRPAGRLPARLDAGVPDHLPERLPDHLLRSAAAGDPPAQADRNSAPAQSVFRAAPPPPNGP